MSRHKPNAMGISLGLLAIGLPVLAAQQEAFAPNQLGLKAHTLRYGHIEYLYAEHGPYGKVRWSPGVIASFERRFSPHFALGLHLSYERLQLNFDSKTYDFGEAVRPALSGVGLLPLLDDRLHLGLRLLVGPSFTWFTHDDTRVFAFGFFGALEGLLTIWVATDFGLSIAVGCHISLQPVQSCEDRCSYSGEDQTLLDAALGYTKIGFAYRF